MHGVITYNKWTVDHLTYSERHRARRDTLSLRGHCSKAYTYDKLDIFATDYLSCKIEAHHICSDITRGRRMCIVIREDVALSIWVVVASEALG
jgi:hypothetical protein